MPKANLTPLGEPPLPAGYQDLQAGVVTLVEAAHASAARSVNALLTATYWDIGRRIMACEQGGEHRAAYGEVLIPSLAEALTHRFGRGFGWRNLTQMRNFYLAWPSAGDRVQTVSAEADVQFLAQRFPLPWSAYVRLLSVPSPEARSFYEREALRAGWSVRQLDREIDSRLFERAAGAQTKAKRLEEGEQADPGDALSPEEAVRDPYVLEFLNLKDDDAESEEQDALIRHLTDFLLELDDDFIFVGRQRRLRLDDTWFRVDLLFFQRRLRCLVVIDLKVGRFTDADANQMRLYLNYAREHWLREGENPPVGLTLCASKGSGVATYALDNQMNKALAAQYLAVLPDVQRLAEELERTQRELETQREIAPTQRTRRHAEGAAMEEVGASLREHSSPYGS